MYYSIFLCRGQAPGAQAVGHDAHIVPSGRETRRHVGMAPYGVRNDGGGGAPIPFAFSAGACYNNSNHSKTMTRGVPAVKKALSLALVLCLLLALLPASASAAAVVLSPQNLMVDGKAVQCEKYNIDGSNYFKLRDLACLLMGTPAQFGVGYDANYNSVIIVPGMPYEPNGTELAVGADNSATAVPSPQSVTIGNASAAGLSIYNIGGSNFFKLRDLGTALGFTVDYDAATNTAIVLSGADSALPVLTAAEVYARCAPAVFYIETTGCDGQPYSSGSGFFIDSRGVAVTNHHVIEDALAATATLTDGRTLPITGVLFFDEVTDFAVIQVEGRDFPTLPVGNSAAVAGGEKVYSIGSPEGLQNSISDGIISNPRREDIGGYIQTTAPISHGSSGGALINDRGQVVGVTVGSIEAGQNLNFAVPINAVLTGKDIESHLRYPDLNLTMAGFASVNEVLRWQSLAAPYEKYYDEGEPNDTLADAPELFNGVTVGGATGGEDMDFFLLRCNCAGTATVLLSAGDLAHVSDLWLLGGAVGGDLSDPVHADLCENDGACCQMLRMAIPAPGMYLVCVFGGEKFAQTDYDLFYCFDPTDTASKNTTGAGFDGTPVGSAEGPKAVGDPTKQAAAFDGIWKWVQRNGAAGENGRTYTWTQTDADGISFTLELIDVELGEIRGLLLRSVYPYSDGDMDVGWLFLERGAQDAVYFSYDYYAAGNSTGDADFTGDVDLAPAAFDGSRPIAFDSTEGPMAEAGEAGYMPFLATYALSDMLTALDSLLKNTVSTGQYTIADFGFDPAKLSTAGLID